MAKVMIVEDDETLRQLLSEEFNNAGFTTVTASDGHRALEIACTTKLSLIITDLKMPNMDGISFIRCIKSITHNNRVPIFLISAHVDQGVMGTINKLGSVCIFHKPFDIPEIINQAKEKVQSIAFPAKYTHETEKFIAQTALETLKEYCMEPPHIDESYSSLAHSGDLSSIITIFGANIYGSIGLSFQRSLIDRIAMRMFKTSARELANLSHDLTDEITNQFAGNLKRNLSQLDEKIHLGLPELSETKMLNHKLPAPVGITALVCDNEFCYVEYCLSNNIK